MGNTFQDILDRYVERRDRQYLNDNIMRDEQFLAMDDAMQSMLELLRDKFEGAHMTDMTPRGSQ